MRRRCLNCDDPQDYIVYPDQHWLDGINIGEDFIRQFVATPVGLGDTIEAQLTGVEEFVGKCDRPSTPNYCDRLS